jgi:hypothetical protein
VKGADNGTTKTGVIPDIHAVAVGVGNVCGFTWYKIEICGDRDSES